MKHKLSLTMFFAIIILCVKGFSQEENPLEKKGHGVFIVKTKAEMAKNEEKLTGKGRAEYAKAKNDFKNIKNATFEIAPNEVLNRDPRELLGGLEDEKLDLKMIEDQNNENKKNQKKIKNELKEINVDAAYLDFSYNTTINISSMELCTWNTSSLTPVKNQNPCGSCWAFAAAATFEHSYAKLYGNKLDLSEQDMVACGVTCDGKDNGSCAGGLVHKALDYIKCKGVANEAAYKYSATSTPCISRLKSNWANAWGQLYPGRFPSVNEIKSYINIFGAVASRMKANLQTFYSYGGGVYNGYPSESSNTCGHVVTIVGWCDKLGAWIIKNSWGTNWGPYGGYAYVGYDQCNIGKYIYWVYPKK
jgi:C1A family cysteine protease